MLSNHIVVQSKAASGSATVQLWIKLNEIAELNSFRLLFNQAFVKWSDKFNPEVELVS